MAARRQTPTPTNGGSDVGSTYADLVNTEVAALWRYSFVPLISVSGTNAILASIDTVIVDAITGYTLGQKFTFTAVNNNSGAVTLNINSVGPIDVRSNTGVALVANELLAGTRYFVEYDGGVFRIIGGLAGGGGPVVMLRDEKANNNPGGASVAGSFGVRNLNTSLRNVLSGASLTSDRITLPAGSYYFEWSCPTGPTVGIHQSRLFNFTDGFQSMLGTTVPQGVSSTGSAFLIIPTPKEFRLEHRATTAVATTGWGTQANFGNAEIYSWLNIWKTG